MGINDENWVIEVCVASMCLFLGISREGRGKMYCSLLPSAKAKGSAWSRCRKNSPKDEENSLPVGDPKPN